MFNSLMSAVTVIRFSRICCDFAFPTQIEKKFSVEISREKVMFCLNDSRFLDVRRKILERRMKQACRLLFPLICLRIMMNFFQCKENLLRHFDQVVCGA